MQLAALHNQCDSYRAQLVESEENYKLMLTTNEQYDRMTSEQSRKYAQLKEQHAELQTKAQLTQNLEKQVEQYEYDMAASRKQLLRLTAFEEKLKEEVAKLQSQVENNNHTIEQQESQLYDLSKELETLTSEKTSAQQRITQLQSTNRQLSLNVQQLQAKMQDQNKVALLEEEIMRLNNEL